MWRDYDRLSTSSVKSEPTAGGHSGFLTGERGGSTMTVYSGPVFDMAVNQFGVIANHLSIPMDERDRILLPIGVEKVRAAKNARGLFP
jgi:hypothetical protein